MLFEPIDKNKRMFEHVLEKIKENINSGALVPGDKLMPERDLACTLQVSRTSVREALRILEIFDVIQSKPGEGTVLKRPEVPRILNKILPFVAISFDASLELIESRKVLEGGIVKLAAKRRKKEDIFKLKETIDRMENTNDLEQRIQADLDFHLYLAKAAYNNTLSDILIVVSDVVSQNLYTTGIHMHASNDVNLKLIEQHKRILKAIEDKNTDIAFKEMENHLDYSMDILKSVINL